MRTVNFRDTVLYGIARRLGMDPRTDLLSVEIYAWVTFINLWVAKLWDKIDFPEWTVIERRTPLAGHLVVLDAKHATPIGKVLKVYLADPNTTPGPLDTPFRLHAEGLHVGFEHGTYVWIKFMLRPPEYTGIPFDGTKTYEIGDLVYDPVTGECYTAGAAAVPGGTPLSDPGPLPDIGPPSPKDITTTATDKTVTSDTAKFTQHDVGASITGPGIPLGTVIASVTNSSTIELSNAATATASDVQVTIGPVPPALVDDMLEFMAGVVTEEGSPDLAIAGAEFSEKDVGSPIESDLFPKGTYILEVIDATHVILSEDALADNDGDEEPIVVGPPGGRWQKVPFPFQLAEPVIRGAYSDAQRSENQTDKAAAEEQAAIGTVTERGAAQLGNDHDLLTDQVRMPKRYGT